MPSAVGEAFLTLRPDTKGFKGMATPGILGAARGLAVAFGATLGAAALIKGAFIDPITSASQFEKTLNVLQAQTGATNAQMDQFSQTAIKLGADVKLPGTSAQDAASAMLQLSKGGLSVRDSMLAAHGVLVASAAAEIDNAQAANIVANALNTFSLSGREAGNVANLLAGAANAATGDMPDFASALNQAGTSAAQLNIPIDTTIGLLTELARRGIQGSDAGTSLRTMLTRLAAPTQQAQQALDKLNISIFDQHGQFVGIRPVIDQFNQKLGGMSDAQRSAAVQTIFGVDAQRAANIIFNEGAVGLDKVTAAVSKKGQAEALAAAQSKGLSGAMQGLRSTVETVQIAIGLKLLPTLTDAVGGLTEFIGLIGKVVAAPNLSVGLHIAVEGLADLGGNIIDSLRNTLLGSRQVVRLPTGRVVGFEDDPGLAASFATAVGGALSGIDWGGVGRTIGHAITGAIQITDDAASAVIGTLLGAFEAHTGDVAEVLVEVLAQMFITILDPGFWIDHWQLAAGVALSALTLAFAPAKFVGVLAKIPLVGALVGPLLRIGNFLRPAVEAFFSGLSSGFLARLPLVGTLGGRVVAAVITQVRLLPTRVGVFFLAMAERAGALLGGLAGRAASLALRLVQGMLRPISTLAGRVAGYIGQMASRAIGLLVSLAGRAGATALNIVTRIITPLTSLAARAGSAIARMATSIVGRLAGLAGTVFGAATDIGHRIVDGILSGAGGLLERLKSYLEDQVGGALSSLNPFSPVEHGAFLYISQPLIEGTIAGLTGLAPQLSRALNSQLVAAARSVTVQNAASSLLPTFSAAVTPGFSGTGIVPLAGAAGGVQQPQTTVTIEHLHVDVPAGTPDPQRFGQDVGRGVIDGIFERAARGRR